MKKNFCAGKIYGNNLFFSMMHTDALCCINLETMEYDIVNRFNMSTGLDVLHKICHLYNEKLYFIPCEGKVIHVYDLQKNQLEHIPINDRKADPCDGIFLLNKLWLFPSVYDDELIVIDLDSYEVEIKRDFWKFCRKYFTNGEAGLKFHRIACDDTIVWLPIFNTKLMISYELLNDKMDVYNLEENITGAFKGKSSLWIGTVEENSIIRWNYSERKCEDVLKTSMHTINKSGPSGIYELDNSLVVVPGYGKEIHKIDLDDKKDTVLHRICDDSYSQEKPNYVRSELNGHKIYVFPYNSEAMTVLDLETNKVDIIELRTYDEIGRYILKDIHSEIIKEDEEFPLQEYIYCVARQ